MTTPDPSQPATATSLATQVPAGVRIASTLCWVVGIFGLIFTLAFGIPSSSSAGGRLLVATDLFAGAMTCVAAVLIRRQWKAGVLFMVMAAGMPTVVGPLEGVSASGAFLLFLALLIAGANWRHFH